MAADGRDAEGQDAGGQMAAADGAGPQAVLDFWFTELTRDDWFRSDAALDARVTRLFRDMHLSLARRVGPEWHATAMTRLAAIIVLDQFPRNMYRATPLAFATDGLARQQADLAIAAGADQAVDAQKRCFFYVPYEHSEELADQDRAVELFQRLGDAEYLDYAIRHRAVIREYGRFPHRNVFLGRVSTAAENAYLAIPGSGF